jgi:hypothetical protein
MEPYKFPLPATDQDFEALIERLNRDRHPDATVQRFGRNGQSQFGIDVLVTRADGTSDAYQCKHVRSLTEAEILAEAAKARSLPSGLSRFIIYTTLPRDTAHQLAAQKANKLHPFLVLISSWDDIAVDLMNNLEASRRYMAELPIHDIVSEYMRQLGIAFDRPAFTDASDMEWSFQSQLGAIKNVQSFLATGVLETRDVRFVLRSLPAKDVPGIRPVMTPLRQGLHALKQAVTPAAKAERSGDHAEAARLGRMSDAVRTNLMTVVNRELIAHNQSPIAFM